MSADLEANDEEIRYRVNQRMKMKPALFQFNQKSIPYQIRVKYHNNTADEKGVHDGSMYLAAPTFHD